MWIVLEPESDATVAGNFATVQEAQAWIDAHGDDANRLKWVIAPFDQDRTT